MIPVKNLAERIDAEVSQASARWDQLKRELLQTYQLRKDRLDQFELAVEVLRKTFEPRFESLTQRFGEHLDMQLTEGPGRRCLTLVFKSELASIKLRLGASPDLDMRGIVLTCDLEILPILIMFDSHVELALPLDALDGEDHVKWLDDRLVDFVRTYFSLQENSYYLQDQMVEDPHVEVQFPRFAAAARLENDGVTNYFIDDSTFREFEEGSRNGHSQVRQSVLDGQSHTPARQIAIGQLPA